MGFKKSGSNQQFHTGIFRVRGQNTVSQMVSRDTPHSGAEEGFGQRHL